LKGSIPKKILLLPKIKHIAPPNFWAVYATFANAETKYIYLVLPMQKRRHNWNWSVKYYKIQQNFTIWKVVKTLAITAIFNGVAQTISYTQAWMSEGGQEFENFSKKVVFLVSSDKNQMSTV